MEKEMATHSSILAWEVPWTGEQVTSYPSQAGGRSSVCGGAEAGRNKGGEGTRRCWSRSQGKEYQGRR